MTSNDERVNFEINGKDLMMRDINVYCTTKAAHRDVLDKLKNMAMQNNTTGASIYDLGEMMQADSLGTLNTALKASEDKQTKQRQEDMAHQEKLKQMEVDKAIQEKKMELDQETMEAEKDRRKDILVAEIRASGFGAMQDINENKQSDFIDAMDNIKQTAAYQDTVNIQREKMTNQVMQDNNKNELKREEMNLKRDLKNKDVEIARENKNQYDTAKTTKEKKKK